MHGAYAKLMLTQSYVTRRFVNLAWMHFCYVTRPLWSTNVLLLKVFFYITGLSRYLAEFWFNILIRNNFSPSCTSQMLCTPYSMHICLCILSTGLTPQDRCVGLHGRFRQIPTHGLREVFCCCSSLGCPVPDTARLHTQPHTQVYVWLLRWPPLHVLSISRAAGGIQRHPQRTLHAESEAGCFSVVAVLTLLVVILTNFCL